MGLYSKPPDLRSVGVIALNVSLHKSKLEQSQYVLRYRINYTCKLISRDYTFVRAYIDKRTNIKKA